MSGLRFWTAALLIAATSLAQTGGPPQQVIDDLFEMPAPAPSWPLPEPAQHTRERSPKHDAPSEELFLYWARFPRGRGAPEPTEEMRLRLLAECEQDPEKLRALYPFLPNSPDAHDRVKAQLDRRTDERRDDAWKDVRRWLMFNSKHYRAELIQAARGAHSNDGWVYGADELEALARLDWRTAEPILREHETRGGPRLAARALALRYQRALQAVGLHAATPLRLGLRNIVEDTTAPGRARNFALDALMESDWAGRDEWYLSLFADPTLRALRDGDLMMHPLNTPVARNPDKWIPVMAELVGDPNRAIHDSAVNTLVAFHLDRARKDALLPLLPWLMNSDWSSAGDRLRLIQSMDRLEMPESTAGLIHIVETGDGSPSERSYAAESLSNYCEPRAISALRIALVQETEEQHRMRIVRAMVACGGLEPAEASDALEALATELGRPGGRKRIEESDAWQAAPLPVELTIGKFLTRFSPTDERLASAVLARSRSVESNRPSVVARMLDIVHSWPHEVVNLDIVRRIADGTASAQSIGRVLERRDQLQLAVRGEVSVLLPSRGTAAAIASVLLAERSAQLSVLRGADLGATRALLASARLVREPLPLLEVERLLSSNSAAVRAASEAYLISEDSFEARGMVLTRYPGEALILGARQDFDPGHDTYSQFDQWEQSLRNEVRADDGPLEIVALLAAGYWGQRGLVVVRRTADGASAAVSLEPNEQRPLSSGEWRELIAFLEQEGVDALPPGAAPIFDGIQYEYVRVSSSGGRRVFMNNPARGTVYGRLVERLLALAGQPRDR